MSMISCFDNAPDSNQDKTHTGNPRKIFRSYIFPSSSPNNTASAHAVVSAAADDRKTTNLEISLFVENNNVAN